MSKITTDLSSLGTSEATQSMQQASNEFTNFMNAPVKKLDADEYMANDLDGVTESLTGSGNLNFLMMQAGQTDEAMSSANPFDLHGRGDFFAPGSLLNNAAYASAPAAYNDIAMDRPFEMPNGLGSGGEVGNPHGANSTTGSLGASQLASNTTSAHPFSDTGNFASSLSNIGSNGNNGTNGNGHNGTSGTSGTSGTNGTSGTDGADGTPGGNTFVTENTFVDLGDVTNITNEFTDFLTELTNNIFDTTNNIFNNIFNEFPFDLGPMGIDLHTVLDDVVDLDLGIISGDQIISVLNEVIDLSPALNPVQDMLGDILTDLHITALLDPFQYDASPNDYDLHVGTGLDILGLQIPDIALNVPLDPIEGLLGDLDIGVDLAQMLDLSNGLLDLPFLPAGPNDMDLALAGLENIVDTTGISNLVETVLNPVEDLVGDIDIGAGLGIDLLGLGNTADAAGMDNDISIPIDIGFIDSPLLNDGLEIGLDPIENLVGDIDIDLGVAVNLLGDAAAPLFDSEAGGLGFQTPLSDLGNGLSGLADQLIPLAGTETGAHSSIGGVLDLGSNLGLANDLDLTQGTLDGDNLGGINDWFNIIDDTLDTALDIVNAIPENTGGLDLGAITSNLGDALPDGGLGSWTETLLPDVGSILGGGLASDPIAMIPDPIIAAPILSLPVVPSLPVGGGLGGLFGGGGSHHHGGLFG